MDKTIVMPGPGTGSGIDVDGIPSGQSDSEKMLNDLNAKLDLLLESQGLAYEPKEVAE